MNIPGCCITLSHTINLAKLGYPHIAMGFYLDPAILRHQQSRRKQRPLLRTFDKWQDTWSAGVQTEA